MKGDLYDAEGRFIGREGGFTSADPLGQQLAAANSRHSSGGGTFTEEENQQRQGNAPAAGTAPAPLSAAEQLAALGSQQSARWAAQEGGRDIQAFANEGPRSGGFRQSSWMGSPPPNINMQSLAATNPNVLNNQNSAANQFAALDRAEAGTPMNTRTDRVIVQGVNGTNSYTRTYDGRIVPTTGSLDAISAQNATGMPSINTGPPMKI